ncbi:hypothetical protein BH23GEM9_BH23GEM9_19760 [soil metagenome]
MMMMMTPIRLTPLPVALVFCLLCVSRADAQITRNPTGVNVSATTATTVFLTFGNLNGRIPVEAEWCGALIPATPHVGERCDPSTVYGRMPLRYDLARSSGLDGMTDIMTIPPSVARRAYQVAQAGGDAMFHYVRRFVDPAGGPDEFVEVTCRMSHGGARTPFALTNVRIAFASEDPVLALRAGQKPPPIVANIHYNGTGHLRGRWEIVRPGDEPPAFEDLLTEATLPLERRGTQRRYTEIARFDVFLPPVGETVLEGPDPALLPSDAGGAYMVLLRIEVSDDKEGDSSLAATGTGVGIVNSGGVAGFALPPLRYFVGSGPAVGVASTGFRQLIPGDGAAIDPALLRFAWTRVPGAVLYRLEVEDGAGEPVLEAVVGGSIVAYEPPDWLADRLGDRAFRWRVLALGAGGSRLTVTPWRDGRLARP